MQDGELLPLVVEEKTPKMRVSNERDSSKAVEIV
jgi:hypothetical protein